MVRFVRSLSAIVVAALACTQSFANVAQAQSAGANQTTVARGTPVTANGTDPNLWLEDKNGARAMAWVRAENAKTLPVLQSDPHYAKLYADALAVAQAKGRIAAPSFIGSDIYNFWQDEQHVRGIWRRTSPADYASANPHWTTVLDLDALSKADNANWVWEGANCNWPQQRRCLISLSDGGEDAVTVREFDLGTKAFVPGGFMLPRGKQEVSWENANTLLVSREWQPGDLTASGYAFIVKRLHRGQTLATATEIYRGQKSDVSASAYSIHDGTGHQAILAQRGVDFFNSQYSIMTPRGLQRLALPSKAQIHDLVDGQLIVTPNEPWTANGRHFASGALLALNLAAAVADPTHLKPQVVYTPGPRESIDGVSATHDRLLVALYQNVRGRALVFTPRTNGTWSTQRLALPDNASVDIVATNPRNAQGFLSVTGFLSPSRLWAVNTRTASAAVAKSLPAQFNASGDVVEQHEATSKDGTKIPYFIVRPRAMRFNGRNPTVMTAYGGFQVSETPYYSGTLGKLWLERGGVFVLANIRGGGEFGPAWHEAGLKTNRQRIYDDFYAVGRDLITRKITSPRHLGIQGGSNGGLLMGVEFTEHPSMWNAVDIQVPLLDMLRFEKIQAGASWVGEYGSVSVPAERAFLAKISPYQNVRAGVAYPEPFIWSTTKDDRVGPQHARKFAAEMAAMHLPYLFYEVTEGGHGAGANLKERAHTSALEWTYFTKKLME